MTAPDGSHNRDEWKEQRCVCGHVRGVHGGHDGLASCALGSCQGCGAFQLSAVSGRPAPRGGYGWER